MTEEVDHTKKCHECGSENLNYSEWRTVWSVDKTFNVKYYCSECHFTWTDKFELDE